jgi:hypothetical protein
MSGNPISRKFGRPKRLHLGNRFRPMELHRGAVPKPTGDWQIHLAAWLIQIARDDPKRLRNVDRLVADAGTHPDNKKIGWLPQDAKQVRRVIVELLRHVR